MNAQKYCHSSSTFTEIEHPVVSGKASSYGRGDAAK